MAKNLALDQWKERKKLQTVIDSLKLKSKELQDRIQEDERQKDNLRKTVNRLVNEKRVLEDKLKFKGLYSLLSMIFSVLIEWIPANDNERIHRLVEENTQWRIRFERLEQQMRELSEEETNTDRHRLQISVLQERIRKQEQQLAQLQLHKTPSNSTNNSLMSEDVIEKIGNSNMVETKLRENIQRLAKWDFGFLARYLYFPIDSFISVHFSHTNII